MKKVLSLILASLLIFTCFTACSDDKNNEISTSSAPAQATTEAAEAETTAASTEPVTDAGLPEAPDLIDGIFSSFETTNLDGEKVTNDILKGKKVTMINFWNTTSDPCIKELPDLQRLSNNYADKGFQIIGIVCDTHYASGLVIEENVASAKDILKTAGVEFENLLPYDALRDSVLAPPYSIPLTYFLDENGTVLGTSFIGSKSYEDWERILLSLL